VVCRDQLHPVYALPGAGSKAAPQPIHLGRAGDQYADLMLFGVAVVEFTQESN